MDKETLDAMQELQRKQLAELEEEKTQYKEKLIDLVSVMLDLVLLKQEINYKHLLNYKNEV